MYVSFGRWRDVHKSGETIDYLGHLVVFPHFHSDVDGDWIVPRVM